MTRPQEGPAAGPGGAQAAGSMDGRTCLITGASRGIGLEAAVALAGLGAGVTMVARDPARGAAALAEVKRRSGSEIVELMIADLASLQAVRQLAGEFRALHRELHVLVNNAGAYNAQRSLTPDGYETTFAVNHLAPFLLTNLLLDALKAGAPSRIVNVASGAHRRATIDFADLNCERSYAGFRTYGQSKLANVLFTYELARRLQGTGVTANCLHPGVVTTGFGKNSNNPRPVRAFMSLFHTLGRPFLKSPAQGAATVVYLASSPAVEGVSGRYFADSKAVPSSAASYDEVVARRLWQVSEEMTQAPPAA
ncbi:MAG: SDR family oxidoreductase [Dehalococcoidia bacterium]|nr:SDR family oxidoreductase [Dehalococcoidia bacterium]